MSNRLPYAKNAGMYGALGGVLQGFNQMAQMQMELEAEQKKFDKDLELASKKADIQLELYEKQKGIDAEHRQPQSPKTSTEYQTYVEVYGREKADEMWAVKEQAELEAIKRSNKGSSKDDKTPLTFSKTYKERTTGNDMTVYTNKETGYSVVKDRSGVITNWLAPSGAEVPEDERTAELFPFFVGKTAPGPEATPDRADDRPNLSLIDSEGNPIFSGKTEKKGALAQGVDKIGSAIGNTIEAIRENSSPRVPDVSLEEAQKMADDLNNNIKRLSAERGEGSEEAIQFLNKQLDLLLSQYKGSGVLSDPRLNNNIFAGRSALTDAMVNY